MPLHDSIEKKKKKKNVSRFYCRRFSPLSWRGSSAAGLAENDWCGSRVAVDRHQHKREGRGRVGRRPLADCSLEEDDPLRPKARGTRRYWMAITRIYTSPVHIRKYVHYLLPSPPPPFSLLRLTLLLVRDAGWTDFDEASERNSIAVLSSVILDDQKKSFSTSLSRVFFFFFYIGDIDSFSSLINRPTYEYLIDKFHQRIYSIFFFFFNREPSIRVAHDSRQYA